MTPDFRGLVAGWGGKWPRIAFLGGLEQNRVLCVFLAVFYLPGFTWHWSLGKLVAVASVGLWLAWGPVGAVWPVGSLAVALYAAVCCLSAWYSLDRWTSLWGLPGTYTTGLLPVLAAVPYWLCAGRREVDRTALFSGLRFAVLVLVPFGVLQRFGGYFLPDPLPTGGRVYSLMGSPVHVGAMVALCWPFLSGKRERLLVLLLLFLTGSRGAWGAVALVEAYTQWPYMSRLKRWAIVLLASAGLVAALTLRPSSDFGRVLIWSAVWDAAKQKPLLGFGLGNFYSVCALAHNPAWDELYGAAWASDHAHNLFAEAAACSGVVGFIAICYTLYSLFANCEDRRARAALLGVAAVGMLNPLPLVVKVLALMLAAVCSAQTNTAKCITVQIRLLAVVVFFAVAWLVHLDIMLTRYGSVPFGNSAIRAAKMSGYLRMAPVRKKN